MSAVARSLTFVMIGSDSFVNAVCGKAKGREDIMIKTQVAEAMKLRKPFIIIWVEGIISEENKDWLREELRGFDVYEVDSPPDITAPVLKKVGEIISLYQPKTKV